MIDNILAWEKEYLRDLAKEQSEIAHLPVMQDRIQMWTDHNDLKGGVPPVTFEMWTVGDEGFNPSCRCETETARNFERQLKGAMANHKMVDDDTPVTSEFICRWDASIEPFNLPIQHVQGDNSIGFHIVEQIKDLSQDVHLIQPSKIEYYKEHTMERYAAAQELFGDILNVRYGMYVVGASLTNNIVQRMGMENMFYSMMDSLTNDYISYMEGLESRAMLWSNNGNDNVYQGSYAFTSQLPVDLSDPAKITMKDCWGYMDSQETVGVAPDMFHEFFFPYFKKIGDRFGLLSYGCCEPVHPIWDNCLSQFTNLRKVSISAWCDEKFMGERLKDSNTIYYRKPSPNYIGVEKYLDEDAFRIHIRNTIEAAKGCKLEFCFRDVYSLGGDLNKAKRAVAIVKDEISRHW